MRGGFPGAANGFSSVVESSLRVVTSSVRCGLPTVTRCVRLPKPSTNCRTEPDGDTLSWNRSHRCVESERGPSRTSITPSTTSAE